MQWGSGMKLPRGVTGFIRGESPTMISFRAFKTLVYQAASHLGARVDGMTESGVTPNFHAAVITVGEEQVQVLCNATCPIFALSEPSSDGCRTLVFIDRASIAESLVRFGAPTVLTTSCLSPHLETADLAALDQSELDQLKYWKPQTIGEVVFNWWD